MGTMHPRPLVHLELHTGAPPEARDFYSELFGWRPEQVHTSAGSYLALECGGQVTGGIVRSHVQRPLWLPYVEVGSITEVAGRAWEMGARILLDPREGPTGWRSVITTPAGGEIAFWQRKR